MRKSRAILAGIILGSTLSAEPTVPPELQIVAAEPAVFLVDVYGDYELTYPKQVVIEDGKLGRDVAAARAAGAVPAGRSDAEHAWVLLAGNPAGYLAASEESLTASLTGRPYSSGTAFAVSREGILLTNAHVLADPDPEKVPHSAAVAELCEKNVLPVLEGLAKFLGGEPAAADAPEVARAVVGWWVGRCRAAGRFRQARLVLKFDRPERKLGAAGVGGYFSPPKAISVPLEILAIGEPAPGKDVAVLRADLQPGERGRLEAAGARADEIDDIVAKGSLDKLICLPLGDSADVLPGARVQALGFPGSAYDPRWMTEAAGYRVSAREGQVGQMKPVRGGYEMLEMSAGIDQGDSGGPVIDSRCRVIGINVGGGANNATTLAVPIDVAREFLAKAGIKPEPGKLTLRWREALAAFGAGDFAKAHALLDLIERFQGSDMVLSALPDPLEPRAEPPGRGAALLLTENLANPYVRDMKRRAAAKLGR